jgi:TusE/DsrC/DsvC family sulfur relay protein
MSLNNLSEWSEEDAVTIAENRGIGPLSDEHWQVIYCMREFYNQYNLSPVMKLLRNMCVNSETTARQAEQKIFQLFPDGTTQIAHVAGLPRPALDVELDPTGKPLEDHPVAKARAKKARPRPIHFLDQFNFNGKTYEVSDNGNLINIGLWSPKLAIFMAEKENLTLTDQHWELIDFIRQFYFEYGIAPMVHLLRNHLREAWGEEKSSEAYLYTLFPHGPSRQGCRVGGLPEPQGCIDP